MKKEFTFFCECISNGTMAEGVELHLAYKKTNSIFFLAENYPQMIFNREMQRVCKGGTLGKILYAEGEYNHPADPFDDSFRKIYNYYPEHWRNYLPRTYYITHSLGPVMRATGATPKTVTAFAIPDFDREEDRKLYENDRLSPFYGIDGSSPTLPCCSHTDFSPDDDQVKKYLRSLGLDTG